MPKVIIGVKLRDRCEVIINDKQPTAWLLHHQFLRLTQIMDADFFQISSFNHSFPKGFDLCIIGCE